jgi:nucleotidyltransferase AbiEii toxin of type IV toxin-antitoxin system
MSTGLLKKNGERSVCPPFFLVPVFPQLWVPAPYANILHMGSAPLDFQSVRRIAITAIFSDDMLFDKVVLKGGNALNIALGISERSSLDLDFSIENDFDDLEEIQNRLRAALMRRFNAVGYTVFDFKFENKPKNAREDMSPRWGGYMVSFKLMEQLKYSHLSANMDAIRRDSLVIGPAMQRVFTIDLSKCEYVKGKRRVEFDDYTVYVYSAEMIAIEKLRAICQQMPEYPLNRTPTRRARDFYDIHLIHAKTDMNFGSGENLELARQTFAAKEVPLPLLKNIGAFREFHRPDWDSVKTSTKGELRPFDYYFDFVLEMVNSMKSLWNE